MNVILVMSDSFRRDHIGAFGNSWIQTPALDRFAAQSTTFPRFRMGSYATIPQRTDMLTGRYSYASRPWQALEPEDFVLAEALHDKGVATYCSADTPHLFHSGKVTFMRGFDAFHWSRGSEVDMWWTDDYNERAYQPPTGKGRIRIGEKRFKAQWSQGRMRQWEMDWTTPQTFQMAIEWLTRNHRRDNFFLYVDTFDPHEPWDPPQWAVDLYDPDYEGIPYTWAEYGSVSQYDKRVLKNLQARYAAECTVVDRWFGRLLDTVDLLGLADNTLVIFIADHGHYIGLPNDGGQVGKHVAFRKSDGKMADKDADVFTPLLDSVSNPPFIVRLPGQTRGAVRNELAQPVDVTPTILDFFGVKIPASVEGQSVLPLIHGKKTPWRTEAVTACHRNFAQISDGRWLYGLWPHNHAPKLFDGKTDPDQKRDVLRKHPEVAKRLHGHLIAEMRRRGASEEWIATLDSNPALRRLGELKAF